MTTLTSMSMSTFIDEQEDAFAADESPLRHELVARVRRQIELGIYEEDRRIDALIDRMLADLSLG